MHFPTYAGGKFIINVLTLSKYTLIMNNKSIDYLSKHPDDYDYRLNTVLKTLPASSHDMKRWVKTYEFSDIQFYGNIFDQWEKGEVISNNAILDIENRDMLFFMTTHSIASMNNLLCNFPKATVVSLVNFDQFQQLSYKKKDSGFRKIDNANECFEKFNLLRGKSWPSWEEFYSIGYNISKLTHKYSSGILEEIHEFYPINIKQKHLIFDVDSCILNEKLFIRQAQKLYTEMNLDDFNESLVRHYWKKYISLHL
jgi:hypothetical protein